MEQMTFQQKLKKYLSEEMIRLNAIKERDTILSVPPCHFYVEPTNVCNHDCIMCVPKEQRGQPGFMDISMWKKIVDNMASHEIMSPVTLIGRGEPLLHKDIVSIVDYGSRHNIPCYIITNGSLLDEKMTKSLLDAGVKKIQVSIHAHSSKSHEFITKKKNYEEIKKNVLRMTEIIKENGYRCHTSVMSCICEANKHEINDFIGYWNSKVDRCFVTELYSMQGDSSLAKESMTAAQKYMKNKKHPGCTVPFFFLSIRWHGSINPCGYDWGEDMVVGNANDVDFDIMKVFNNESMQNLRKCMFTSDFSFCKKYNYPCETCEWPFDPDAFRGLDDHVNNFPELFSRNFSGALK
ncbi:MAG: radical SAM protein [Oligoflexia bacterium]|nr:radical SAM protein [Oligoflexia bacterium]